jgi:hypothetical protein
MVLYLCELTVFSLRRESLKLILVDEPLPEEDLSHVMPPWVSGLLLLGPWFSAPTYRLEKGGGQHRVHVFGGRYRGEVVA